MAENKGILLEVIRKEKIKFFPPSFKAGLSLGD